MILTTLSLRNFRRFEHLTVEFHPQLTVIVAKNGQGKSTILDAAAVALGTFVGAFDLGRAKPIDVQDARYARRSGSSDNEQQFPVAITAAYGDPEITIQRALNGKKNKTTIKEAAELTHYGKALMDRVRNLEEYTLPAIAYYGSGRLWVAHKNRTRKSVLSASRSMGYEDCLSSASSFTQVQQWLAKATFAVIQQQEMPQYQGYKLSEQLEGIKRAVNSVLEPQGWSNFHYSFSHEELAMYHQDHGLLPVSLLSDGVRAMISLTADLAWRCAKLNPHLHMDATAETPGIVFIDEIDMHLHPSWQQQVVRSLRSVFPKMQFIVTTHSPQVLSTVPADSIRLLKQTIDPETGAVLSVVEPPASQSLGVASSDILAELMGVDPTPDVEEAQWLNQYRALIQQNLHQREDSQQLRARLEQHFGADHPEIIACDRLIRFEAVKQQMAKKK